MRVPDEEGHMKIYRRHRCSAQRCTYRTLLKRVWFRDVWVHGEVPFALVSHCRSITVSLHATPEAAEAQKGFIDSSPGGQACCPSWLAYPPARATSSKGAPKVQR
jgi:hypothetical protein